MSSHRKRLVPILLLFACLAGAEEELRTVSVTYITAEGAFVDAGSDVGLTQALSGIVRRNGSQVAHVEITAVTRTSARIRRVTGVALAVGDRVEFRVERRAAEADRGAKRSEESEKFVPLLERQRHAAKAKQRRNVVHGTATVRHLMQLADQAAADFHMTMLSSSGAVTRLAGRRWALRWNGNLRVRGGDAFDGGTLDGAELHVYELALRMHVGESGLLDVGRVVGRALSAVGRLDGAIYETGAEELRFGGGLGFQPAREDLAPSVDHPTAFGYVTFGQDTTGTIGLLSRLFKSDVDRVALLGEMATTSGALHARTSFEIDFDVGASIVRNDAIRLTRMDAIVRWVLSPRSRLRLGIDHNERLDNRAERTALGSTAPEFFDDGFWRGFVGGAFDLSPGLHLDVELAALDGPQADDPLRWRASLTRSFDAGSATLTVYNLGGSDVEGVGGLLHAYIPFGRWTVLPSVGFRTIDGAGGDVTDVRLRVEYRFRSQWSVAAGLAHVTGDFSEATSIDFELRTTW